MNAREMARDALNDSSDFIGMLTKSAAGQVILNQNDVAVAALEAVQVEPVGWYAGKDSEYGYDLIDLNISIPIGTDLFATPQEPAVNAELLETAKRLVEHADFKLGGALSADSKAKEIPSNAVSQVKARHLAALRAVIAKAKKLKQVNS